MFDASRFMSCVRAVSVLGMLTATASFAVQPPLQQSEADVMQAVEVEEVVGISVWRDRFEEEQQTAFFASLGPIEGAEALRVNAERLFGAYVPEHHDALLLEGDIMDPGLWDEGLGMTGGGEPFWFTVAEVFEAPLPADLPLALGHADLRGGFVMLELATPAATTPAATTHISALWVRYDGQTLIQPAVVFQNADAAGPVYASLGEELRDCPTCIYQNCMDAQAKAEYQTFKAQFDQKKYGAAWSNLLGALGCGAAAVVSCTAGSAVPVIGWAACGTTGTCMVGFLYCMTKSAVLFDSEDKGYAACLCAQSRQRAAGGPVGGCQPPQAPKCKD